MNKPQQSKTEVKVTLPLSFAQIQMFPYMRYRPIGFCSSHAFQYLRKKNHNEQKYATMDLCSRWHDGMMNGCAVTNE